ncbi:MAG: Stp1/IreP family PP2C-type Ser/Thr phosphatase, partial [Acidimicrobiales bacterium]|nr:Stp1/IreP family PP2C-type Ser/Thr phosphatase [Acidimicrobiales bacterium]
MIRIHSGGSSDVGRVRPVNQDRLLNSPPLFAVADGMGGHVGGEIAASSAIEELIVAFEKNETGEGLASAVRIANLAVWNQGMDEIGLRGMGTTLTAAALLENDDGNLVLSIAHVGDSRAYFLRKGNLSQLTKDHTLVEELVRRGQITPTQALTDRRRHTLTRALGIEPHVTVDSVAKTVESGDRILICSDGLSNEVSDREITTLLEREGPAQEIAEDLIRLARAHGGRDNITAVVIQVGKLRSKSSSGTSSRRTKGKSKQLEAEIAELTLVDAPVQDSTDKVGSNSLSSEVVSELELDEEVTTVTTEFIPAVTEISDIKPPEVPHKHEVHSVNGHTGEHSPGIKRHVSTRAKGDLIFDVEPESRIERRRRHKAPPILTFRVLAFLIGLGIAAIATTLTVQWFVKNSYYIGISGQQVVIFHGRPGGIAWFAPSIVQKTQLTTSDILPSQLTALEQGVMEPSIADANKVISNLKKQQGEVGLGGATTTTTSIGTNTTTTINISGNSGSG